MKPVKDWPEHYRQTGPHLLQWSSQPGEDFGLFVFKRHGEQIRCIVSCGAQEESEGLGEPGDWEHVSVSLENRCPSWDEMCVVKNMFWGPEELVVEYHPPESQYVNVHRYCLHLWKWKKGPFPAPPMICVGPPTNPKP